MLGVSEQEDYFGATMTTGDFNGDGKSDIAIGVGGEDLGSIQNAGGVNVLYGTDSGIRAAGNQFWSLGSAGVPGASISGDFFAGTIFD